MSNSFLSLSGKRRTHLDSSLALGLAARDATAAVQRGLQHVQAPQRRLQAAGRQDRDAVVAQLVGQLVERVPGSIYGQRQRIALVTDEQRWIYPNGNDVRTQSGPLP